MKLTVYTIYAFAKTKEGGNPAGVVLNADSLSENDMKKIAGIMGFSETAFVMKSTAADYKIRFFTTTDEVDLCGHATIGTFSLLFQKGLIKSGNYTQETKAGILKIRIKEDGMILMEQTKPQFLDAVEKEAIAETLNIKVEDLDENFEPQVVSTGLKDAMIAVKNKSILDAIRPDTDKVIKLCKERDIVGYHMFALDTLYHDTAYCRNIAPLYGIMEEAATGTSNGALACYLTKYQKLGQKEAEKLVFEQGYFMGRPSEICASISLHNDEIDEVEVGGIARNIQERIVEI